MCVVCQVEVSATVRSLVRRSPAVCVCVYVFASWREGVSLSSLFHCCVLVCDQMQQ